MPGRPRTWDTIPEMVLSTADRFGDAEAIVDGDHRITFEELTDKVRTAAGAYIEAGVKQGDRVAIWAPNSAEWIIAAFGLLAAGGVLVPVNTRFKAAEPATLSGAARRSRPPSSASRERLGQVGKAFIVRADDKVTAEELIAWAKTGWPASKRQDTSNSSTRSR